MIMSAPRGACDPGRSVLKQRLRAQPGVAAFWMSLGSPTIVEIAARARPDVFIFDLQHGLWDRVTLELALGAVPPDIGSLVRVSENTAASIGHALDAGAQGVIVPLIETAEEAARSVALAHYPPKGVRSGGGVRPLASDFAAYRERANTSIAVGVMIETVRGVENVDLIAGTPGIDLILIGTGDLALSLGCFPGLDSAHRAACSKILDACRMVGLPCGIFTNSAEEAAARHAEGYALAVAANDLRLLVAGFDTAMRSVAAPLLTLEEPI
jgi:2-keto-3-deoxy-L-rhamnonate aldolase RhmA